MAWLNGAFFFFQAEDGIRDSSVTGVQTCALPISGVTGGHGATVIRQRARMYAQGKNVTIPRKRPRFIKPVDVVRNPARGSTITRSSVYANAPIERTVARSPGSSRRFRNAVVSVGWSVQTTYTGSWKSTAPGNWPTPYIPKNAADAMRIMRAMDPNSPRTRVIRPVNADQRAAKTRKPLIDSAICASERPRKRR